MKTKRICLLALLLALCLVLTACGESAALTAAKEAVAALPGVEELTLEDKGLVDAAREAIAALEEKDRAALGEAADLREYDYRLTELEEKAAEDALIASFVGSWKMLYGSSYEVHEFTLNEDLTCTLDGSAGEWQVFTQDNSLSARSEATDSYLFLMRKDWNNQDRLASSISSDGTVYVRADAFEAIYNDMFTTVEITAKNLSDYQGEFVQIGHHFDQWGEKQGNAYFFPSAVYKDGLVLFDVSEDFAFEYTYRRSDGSRYGTYDSTATENQPFTMDFSFGDYEESFKSITRAKGTLVFIKADYVAENRMNADGERELVLTDGSVITNYRTFSSYYWQNTDARYQDWKY